ncbi:MAG: hypothetical protein K6B68_02865 [Eubacterium sp.]|nr:hypothetical protein [Eubacterium sp.]
MKESNNFDDILSENNNIETGDNNNQLDDDISINLAGNYRFSEEENSAENNIENNLGDNEEINLQGIGEDELDEKLISQNQIQEEDLYFNEDQLNQEDIQTDTIREVPGDNLFQGILEENGLGEWEDMELEGREVQKEEALQRENQLKANLAVEEAKKKKQEEEKKLKEEEKAAKKEAKKLAAEEAKKKKEAEKIPERHFDTPYMRGHADYYSEQRGYKDHVFEEGVNTKNANDIHVLKYAVRELGRGTAKRSQEQKKLAKDLEAFDTFMKEIEGRTKLTPREMEVYDALSLKVYKSGKEYREHLLERKEKEKKAFDEKHKNDKYTVEYEMSQDMTGKMEGTTQLMETIERMRKETFKKEMEEKQKELAEACRKEADKAEAIRDEMEAHKDNPNNLKALQHNMEESIARTIFYNNRIERLTKQGEFDVKPDESLTKARERLDKAIQPTPAELDEIKKTDLCKSLYNKGWEKLQEGDLLTTGDISEAQKEYKKAEGSRIGMRKWREQNMRPVKPAEKNKEQEKKLENKQPQLGSK